MTRLHGLLLACAFVVLAPQVATAWIESITITPEGPHQNEPVSIRVAGYFPNLCWSLVSTSCDSLRGYNIYLSLQGFDTNVPDCYQQLVPYIFSCDYPSLAPGAYTVHATEFHDSQRDPDPWIQERAFEVTRTVAVERTTWGCLRLMYR